MKKNSKSLKTFWKSLETRYKNMLIVKLQKARKENKHLKKELQEQVLEKYGLYDVINSKQREIRELRLDYEKTQKG